MELEELREDLEIVFDKEESDLKNQGYSYVYKGSQAKNITYPNSEMLLQIFAEMGNDAASAFFKYTFVEILKKKVVESDEIICLLITGGCSYVGTSALCFYALIETGYVNDAIESFKKRQNGCCGIYRLLLVILGKTYFDSNQLKELSNILKVTRGCDEEEPLRYKMAQTRFEQLETKIKKVNIEINQDKITVTEKISLLGLSTNYVELLNCIDSFILTDTSKVVNAGMISTLRTFMADLLKDIATRLAKSEGTKIPHAEGKSEMGDIRSYLKSKLDFTDTDDKFIDSFVDILHAEGGHSFMSEKEYFRLSRNIAIEIALFVLSKYEKKYKI